MDNPRNARVAEQHFLNLPGFHAGVYVRAYVEDTSGRAIRLPEGQHGGRAPGEVAAGTSIRSCAIRFNVTMGPILPPSPYGAGKIAWLLVIPVIVAAVLYMTS